MEQVYEYLRGNGSATRPLYKGYRDGELAPEAAASWSRRSHDDRVAAEVRSAIETSLGDHAQPTLALPARAQIASESREAASPGNYRHVIVDEAQDLTLDDWLMLRRLNSGGAWTILGDFHQRRADKTPKNWEVVLGHSDSRRYAPALGCRGLSLNHANPQICPRTVAGQCRASCRTAPTGLAP